ncbi:hypothetical protein QLX08_011499 [Tetragonisca angustula]|uniref:Uncharacterized protein n=1 Tax=Tetragonisca angustula TaxID=166442 RepID=A0AAW0Z852_9HYME
MPSGYVHAMSLYLFRGVQAEGMVNGSGAVTWTDKRKQSTDARRRSSGTDGGCCTRHGQEMREKKRKTAPGYGRKDKRTRQTEYEKRTRMLIGLKLNPTHLSLLAAFRSALFPPIRSFLLWVFVLLPGSLALRAKIGTSYSADLLPSGGTKDSPVRE